MPDLSTSTTTPSASQGSGSAARQLEPTGAGVEPEAPYHGGQHGLHLEQREAGAEAAPAAAAERDPRVGAGRLLEEALGAERVRLGIHVGVVVDEVRVR